MALIASGKACLSFLIICLPTCHNVFVNVVDCLGSTYWIIAVTTNAVMTLFNVALVEVVHDDMLSILHKIDIYVYWQIQFSSDIWCAYLVKW